MELILFVALIVVGGVAFNANSRIGHLETELRSLRRQIESGFRKSSSKKEQKPPNLNFNTSPSPVPKPETTPVKTAALAATPKTISPNMASPKMKPAKPIKKRRSFEEEIGARWAVWVGGLTLALGAIFLLRFAVEAGVFTPVMRVGLAALLGSLSLGAGELLRRKDKAFFKDKLKIGSLEQSAYIPGVLTGVGIFTLFGAIYSAYALYGLIPALMAFIGMGLVSFTAFGLSLLQGPKIAALGLVGSLATPLLVSSDLSNYPMLFSYLAIVTVASLVLSRFKKWGWLAIAALFGALFWMWMTAYKASIALEFWPWCIFAAALFAAAIWVSRHTDVQANNSSNGLLDLDLDIKAFAAIPALIWFALWALILFQLDSIMLVQSERFNFGAPQHVMSCLGAGALMVAGYFSKRLPQILLIGGILAIAVIQAIAVRGYNLSPIYWFTPALSLSLLFIGLTALKAKSEKNYFGAGIWAGLGVLIPTLIILSSDFIKAFPKATTTSLMVGALLLNMGLAIAMPRSHREEKGLLPFIGPAAFYCGGAAMTYSLAAGYGLNGWPFSLAMMLGIPLSVAAYQFLKEPILKVIAVGFAAITALHVLFIQLPLGMSVGPKVIINSLWFYLALPSALCAMGAWYMHKRGMGNDIWTELLKAFALAFAALFAVFQVRHLMNDGNLLSNNFTFDEMAMQVLTGLCFTLGGLNLGRREAVKKPSLLSVLAMGISGITLALFVLGVCFVHNPLLNKMTLVKGGAVFNNLMLAFLLPALGLAGIAWLGRKTRSAHYLRVCGGLSLVSFMIYITAMIRRGFSGTMISLFKDWPGDVELYAISAAWLVLGVGLLTLGMKLGRRDIRLASAFVIILTVLKAFLVDMASLEGAFRAMSFVVLGVVLIVIGRVYQRILFSNSEEPV